jgi:hypothetical protein
MIQSFELHITNVADRSGRIFNKACRVMAKRLRDVCGLPESESLWKAGCGFVVREAW